jgi:L-ascorbate metabolism protein UlaG (beta-lactamase superfamily)
VKHWGARWKTDSYRGYNGYVIRKDGKEFLFGGDTAYSKTFKDLSVKPDLAIMPIGSYGSKSGNHCTPEEAILMANECRANYVLPIHHKTFPIGKEALEEPLQRFERGIEQERIALRAVGETWELPG